MPILCIHSSGKDNKISLLHTFLSGKIRLFSIFLPAYTLFSIFDGQEVFKKRAITAKTWSNEGVRYTNIIINLHCTTL